MKRNSYYRKLTVLLRIMAPLFFPYSGNAQIIINEIMPANASVFLDPTNNYSGWVEFYNQGNTEQSLYGYFLSDDPNKPKKYQIPGTNAIIPAKGYLVYWFDHHDLSRDQASFKLDCEGSELTLRAPNGTIVTSIDFPVQVQNTSYARTTDGADLWSYCTTPTPGKSNNNATYAVERCPEPEFNITGGLYKDPVTVQISCPSAMQIHYTTDGSEPTENSTVWNENKQFSETTILRARVMANGYIPGPIFTQSYIFSNRDFTLPVVSVVTDPKNLWDDEIGIYCIGTNGIAGNCVEYPANWNCDWNRPANIEIMGDSKQFFSQECDIVIGGKCSRMSKVKTLKLNAEKKFDGRNHFLYPFFQAKPGLRYKSLFLRNAGGNLMRDAMQQCLIEGVIDMDYQAYQPTVHFINGEYYGIINLRERSNHHFIYSNYGYDKEDIDLIGLSSFAYYGSIKEFEELAFQTANAADPDVYKDITEKMDIDEFITYFITEIYVGNSDWPGNNFKNFRHRKHGKWRWILYDLDAGFTNLDANTFERFPTHTSLSVKMLLNLAKNESFRQRFIDYFTICMGSVFHPERVHTIIDSLSNQIWPEVPYHQEKSYFDLEKECQNLKEFASKREGIVLEQIKNFFELKEPIPLSIESSLSHAQLFMNKIKLPLKKMEGHTFKGNKLILKAIAPTGYRFERWKNMDTDHVTILQSYFESEITITAENALNMQAEFIKENEEGNAIPAIHINEVSASNNIHMNEYYSKEDWIELYNSSDTSVSIAGLYLSHDPEDLMQYRIPDTPEELTVIPAFGYRILWADKMEDLTQLHLPFKLPAEGATLQLSCFEEDAEGIQTLAWSNQLTYPPHTAVQTFGRYPDGGSSAYTMNRNTFAAPNLFSLYNVEDPTTSIDKSIVNGEDNGGINIYYNSSSAILTIEMQTESTSGQSLTIYNLLGQSEVTYSIPAHQTSYIIDLNEIKNGYHIAILSSSGKRITVFKFIK